jgi:hypothetical protein
VELALILWNQTSNWNFGDYTNRHIVVTGGHFAKFHNLSSPKPCIEICLKLNIIRGISRLRLVGQRFTFRWLNFSSDLMYRQFLAVFHDFWLKNLSPLRLSFKMWSKFLKVHFVTCLRFVGSFFLKFSFIIKNIVFVSIWSEIHFVDKQFGALWLP